MSHECVQKSKCKLHLTHYLFNLYIALYPPLYSVIVVYVYGKTQLF